MSSLPFITSVLICPNLIATPDTNLNPEEFVCVCVCVCVGTHARAAAKVSWALICLEFVDSVLMPSNFIIALPEMYPVICGCKKKCTGKCQCNKFGTSCTKF